MSRSQLCPICGDQDSFDIDILSRQFFGELTIMECKQCAHRFLLDAPTNEALQTYYDGHYQCDSRQQGLPRAGLRDRALARSLLRVLPLNAHILEIGSNFGGMLMAMPKTYQLEGVELSATAAAAAAREPRLTIYNGFFEDIASKLPQSTYNCVIALAVIEHIRNPIDFLSRIASLLAPGGVAVIMTGDYASWNACHLGASWNLYHSDGHLHFFSDKSLSAACSLVGLSVYAKVWAGPNPFTFRLPRLLGRALHCQTTTLLLPFLFGHRPLGDLMYVWCRKPH